MTLKARRLVFGIVALVLLCGGCVAATFGTAVPVRGTVSDIALDESRGQLYISNFTAGRVEVMSTSNYSFGTPLTVAGPPSSVALSPDNRYLVVGEYCNLYAAPAPVGGYAIFDLQAGTKREVVLGSPVLAVAFGAGNQALVVTGQSMPATCGTPSGTSTTTAGGQFLLLDPASGGTQVLGVSPAGGLSLPVPFATFPANITYASTGISGDQQTIMILTEVAQGGGGGQGQTGTLTSILYYKVGSGQVNTLNWVASPPFGPRAISVNQDGTRFVAGWILFDLNLAIEGASLAQFPYPLGDYRLGGFAYDYSRNVIYGDIPVTATETPVMHIFDTDNLTVRERIQLPQMIAGRTLFSSDMNTVYAVADEGVMILPVGSLATAPQVAAQQEDVVFLSNTCNSASISQTLNVADLGGNNTPFTLSLPSGTQGIQLSATSGTTPAQVQISVDVTAYQTAKGTTTIPLTINSANSINIPPTVRLLINTRDLNQRGQMVDVPGKIVDILADPVRSRVYVLRQDKNQVLVYDTGTLQQIGPPLRTGNTPVGMAITRDDTKLIVTNDNSQIANVFDLTALGAGASSSAACAGQANAGSVSADCSRGGASAASVKHAAGMTEQRGGIFERGRTHATADFFPDAVGALDPILFPGAYPHSIAVGNGQIWVVVRDVSLPAGLFRVDLSTDFAAPPPSLGIYDNTDLNKVDPGTALASSPSGNSIFLAEPDGNVLLWDAFSGFWIVSRHDLSSLGGAYGALNDDLFVADNHVLDQALSPIALFESTTGSSSGVGVATDPQAGVLAGLRTTVASPSGPGILERFGIDPTNSAFYLQTYNGTAITEAPVTATSLLTPPVGQIGQTILPFTRTLAVPANQNSVILLTQSGLTVLPADFDAALAMPSVSGVVNSADGGTDIAPGSLILISGTNLAPDSAVAGTSPLPSTLGDTCVMVDNTPLPLFQVSPTQIVAQLPNSVGGSETLVIHTPGGLSSPFTLDIAASAPAVLHTAVGDGQTGLPNVIRHDDGQPVDFTNPIHPNQAISIYLDGLGPTVPVVPPGVPSPSNPAAVLATPPVVTLEGVTLTVTFAGLDPGQIGVYRVDATVPYNIASAAQAALVVTEGAASTSLQVRVVNP
jgi:uncharacterized protein (TIGR03437 family)